MRQQEKTKLTREELIKAMKTLFLEKGYTETTLRDITATAQFSVGTFYRYWDSKQQAFIELWDEYVSAFIRESVKNVPVCESRETVIDYLILRANQFSQNEFTVKLYMTSRVLSALYDYESVNIWADRYRRMLVDFLRRTTLCQDDDKLLDTAGLMHVLLDAHAMHPDISGSPLSMRVKDDSIRTCLLAMVGTLDDELPKPAP